MLRKALAVALVGLPLVAGFAPLPANAGAETTLAIGREAPGARVRVTHRARRILSCYAKEVEGQTKCRSKRTNLDSATTAKLVPIKDPSITEDDPRSEVVVTFPSSMVRGEQFVDLEPGIWEVQWGKAKKVRALVVNGKDFKIWLRSVSGRCKKDGDGCALVPSAKSRKVVVQAAHLARG